MFRADAVVKVAGLSAFLPKAAWGVPRYIARVQGLYAIVDAGACARRGVSSIAVAEAVLSAGPAMVQLRAKDLGARATLELLREIGPRCRDARVPLVANDRPDLALLAGCDGVHLGQSDLPARDVRELVAKLGRPLAIGISTHGSADIERALREPVDVIAIGPVFGTANKDEPEPTVGIDTALALAEKLRAERPSVTRVAIGGIEVETIPQLRRSFDLVAVIGALFPPDEGQHVSGSAVIEGVRERAHRLVAAAQAAER